MTSVSTDLRKYEREKFELAEVLRSVELLPARTSRTNDKQVRELFVRLAEDRFNLVVVGRFSRGKSSLMNAIMGIDRLPVGIVPLTSVITTVAYGSKEKAIIRYQDSNRMGVEISLAELPKYVTQQHNPGNVMKVNMAEVKLPVEILRRGFHFVDTPGLGSPIPENTRTTEDFLPEADAFLLVTSYDSPLAEEDLRILRVAVSTARRVLVVVNKQDTVSSEEREEALSYVHRQLIQELGATVPQVFSVSARQGLEAKFSGNATALSASGIENLERELVQFLLADKSAEFLLRLCDRVADLIGELVPSVEAMQLMERIRSLSARIAVGHPATMLCENEPQVSYDTPGVLQQLRPCEICTHITDASFEFLRNYQYDLIINPEVQRIHAEHGGLCGLHTWQYEAVASVRGICIGYPALLERLSDRLRHIGAAALSIDSAAQVQALLSTQETCVLCRELDKAEADAVASLASLIAVEPERALNSLSAICIPHLHPLIAAIDDTAAIRMLLERQANILERLGEDMRRYATKHDAIRSFLASEEERNAGQRMLAIVVGLRNVHLAQKIE